MDRLVALLEARGSGSIAMLADHFAVSDETIRRHVRQLEAAGRAYRMQGGVKLHDNRSEAPYR